MNASGQVGIKQQTKAESSGCGTGHASMAIPYQAKPPVSIVFLGQDAATHPCLGLLAETEISALDYVTFIANLSVNRSQKVRGLEACTAARLVIRLAEVPDSMHKPSTSQHK